MNKTKNLKVTALILLTSAILLAAMPLHVAAATQDSMYVYSSIGGTVSAGGTDLTGGTSYNYDDGSTVAFTATPDSGYQFLGWATLTATSQTTSTTNPLPFTFSESCALQAMFVPTSNATAAASTTGTSTVIILASAGGTTEPLAGSYTNYTVGTVSNFNAVPGNGFKFLYWMIAPSTSNTFTNNQVAWNVTADVCALQAFFVPTSSTLTLPGTSASPAPSPTIPEYSGAATVIIAVALVAVAFGTYTYRRKAKN